MHQMVVAFKAKDTLQVKRMIKNPWRKDGSVRYFELFKIATFAMLFAMGFSFVLEATLPLGEVSALASMVVVALLVLQLTLLNLSALKAILAFLKLKLIELISIDLAPLKRSFELKVIAIAYHFKNGLAPILKYRVIRV